jgi:hypothetical protein
MENSASPAPIIAPESDFPESSKSLPESIKSTLGRKPEYIPEYCDSVIVFMAKGHSLTAFAHSIRVAPQTVRNWVKAYPEFADAVDIGRAGRVQLEEERLNRNGKALTGPILGAAWRVLTNIAPDEYRDKVTIDSGQGTTQEALSQMREEFRGIVQQVAGSLTHNKALAASSVIEAEFSEVESIQPDNQHTDDSIEATKKAPE